MLPDQSPSWVLVLNWEYNPTVYYQFRVQLCLYTNSLLQEITAVFLESFRRMTSS